MAKNEHETWSKEFTDFSNLSSQDVAVPQHLFEAIKGRLFPNPWKVFGKIAAIHFFVGSLSLAVCNQFGLNPFNTNYSLSDFFMKVAGHNFCMFACGVFFVATTYLIANFVLSLEELEALRKYEWLQTGVLSLVSIGAFSFLGAELVMTFVGLWLIGAFIGGLLSIEGSYRFRRQLV